MSIIFPKWDHSLFFLVDGVSTKFGRGPLACATSAINVRARERKLQISFMLTLPKRKDQAAGGGSFGKKNTRKKIPFFVFSSSN